jgi:hypothetical protein
MLAPQSYGVNFNVIFLPVRRRTARQKTVWLTKTASQTASMLAKAYGALLVFGHFAS